MTVKHSLAGPMKWLTREPWPEAFAAVLEEHLGPACEEAGIEDMEALEDRLGEAAFGMVWGCAFEDFLSRDTEAGNLIDAYLKRRGWNESASNRAYMTALRRSVLSLYAIDAVDPGESFLARDLVRGGEPVRVSERTATRMMQPGDRAALRVVTVQGRTIMGGGVLPFEPETADAVLEELRRILVEEGGEEGDEPALRLAAPFLTAVWLADQLGGPTIVNTEGEPLVFVQLRYPLNKGVTQKQLRARLDAVPEFEAAGAKFWNWLRRDDDAPAAAPEGAQMLVSRMDDGALVLGTLDLQGRHLTVEVNSEGRAERAQAVLAPLLQGLTGPPILTRPEPDAEATPLASGLPPEAERELVQAAMERHFRALLDTPIPALDDKTPRTADRAKLVPWLAQLEEHLADQPADSPMAGYDLAWLRRELGLD